ncbi:MAG: hypothetical protein QW674_01755 [Candidatus Bathyarchaeia archaeon]
MAASVFVSSKDIDEEEPLKHHFYEECKDLFTFMQKNMAKRIGIITATIENEAFGVLDKVIEGELRRRGFSRSENFEVFSRVFNICDIKMRQLIGMLQREPVDAFDVAIKFTMVRKLYDEMEKRQLLCPKLLKQKNKLYPKALKVRLTGGSFMLIKTDSYIPKF